MKIKVNCATCNKEFEVDKRTYTEYNKKDINSFVQKNVENYLT